MKRDETPLLLKITIGKWENASRDKRELSVCRELGMDIAVMAKGEVNGMVETVSGYCVHRFSTRPLGEAKWLVPLNRLLTFFTWARYARAFEADIISGHDIFALLIGWMSTWWMSKTDKPKLVYDSHEFEIGRSAQRSKLTVWGITHLERFLIRRCAFSVMINDGIANEVQRIHRLPERSVVVRSTPTRWHLDEAAIAETRKDMLKQLDLPADTFIVMYHGMLVKNRGIESMLQAVAQTQNTAAVILGNCPEPAFESSLRSLCNTLKIEQRVIFLPAVPLDALSRFVGAADVGVVIHPAATKNYYYVLPNKFFENIQALTPLICSDLPELARLVNQYKIGVLVDPNSIACVAKTIEHMRDDKDAYAQYKRNLVIAKDELCWEKEKQILSKAYSKILPKVESRY